MGDDVESLLHLEQDFVDQGRKDGYAKAAVDGQVDGFRYGAVKGLEVSPCPTVVLPYLAMLTDEYVWCSMYEVLQYHPSW